MIIYEEEYRVQATKIAQWHENHLKFEKIMKNLDVPSFLKGWWVWQDRFTPGLIRCVWVVEELGDIERLWDECFVHNEAWAEMVPKIFDTMVDGTYKYSFWKPVGDEQNLP